MHLAFLAPDIDLSGFTGDVWHVKDLTRAFARAGCTVDLVVANPAGWDPSPAVRVYAAPPGSFLAAARSLRASFLENPPDVLYERRGSPKLAATLSRALDRPYFVEINGLADEEKEMQGRPERGFRALQSAKRVVRGKLLSGASGIVTVTGGLRDALVELHGLPPSLFRVVPNGVDLQLFQPRQMEDARKALRVPLQAHVAVFVGNLVAWQGVATLLEAINIARHDLEDLRLIIVGDGIERESLADRASNLRLGESIRFVGRVPREDVPEWIAAADLAVMPSTIKRNLRIGSSALKLREYLACGRAVIATNLEGAGPLLEREGIGLGVPGDDPEALARAIVSLLRDPETLLGMGRRARIYAEHELSWDRSAREILNLFDRVLKSRMEVTG